MTQNEVTDLIRQNAAKAGLTPAEYARRINEMNPKPTIEPGQVWQERTPRKSFRGERRKVTVVFVGELTITADVQHPDGPEFDYREKFAAYAFERVS